MNRPDVDEIINAADAGREGELIFMLVYNYCKCRKPIKRLWVNSLEEKALAEGFKNLRDGEDYDRLYKAAVCRSQADFIVGMNGSRLFTLIYNTKLNIGRVQTPTLALIVNRENEIANFVKESFYNVELDCGNFKVTGEKIKDKGEAEKIREVCDSKTVRVKSVEKQEKYVSPPKLYDLTGLQREANRRYNFSAAQTLEYVQSLYEKKILTYPRTDSCYLTDDMEEKLPALVTAAAKIFFKNADLTPKINAKQVIDNSKVSDHHAIIITETAITADLSGIPSGEMKIVEMVAERMICAVGDKQIYNETIVTVECETHIFTAKGRTIIDNGWKLIKPNEKSEEKILPKFKENQIIENAHAILKEGFTSPPKSFTEDTLLSAMETAGDFTKIPDSERRGIGTPATRANTIEKLIKDGYIERKTVKKVTELKPTEKGVQLIKILPDTIKSPQLTAEWEYRLKMVEKNELSDVDFMAEIAEFMRKMISENSTVNGAGVFASDKETDICPKCGGKVYEWDKYFSCENYRGKTCKFIIGKDNKFFTAAKKKVTEQLVKAMIKDGKLDMKGLYSQKSGKNYDATVVMTYNDEGYPNFKPQFDKKI